MSDESRSSEPFKEKVQLLLLTALLTGILVPSITSILAELRSRNERVKTAELAKQASLIRSQEEFLVQLEKTIFQFHTQAAALAWYRSQQPDNAKYERAREAYDQAAWKFMADMHASVSKAKRITSPEVFRALQVHQHRWEVLDLDLVRLSRKDAAPEVWLKMLERINRQATDASDVLEKLAIDYGLARRRWWDVFLS